MKSNLYQQITCLSLTVVILSHCGDGSSVLSIHDAAQNGSFNGVRNAVYMGTDINSQDQSGKTALFIAAQNNDLEMVKALLNMKAKPNAGMGHPLVPAYENNNTEMIDLLIQHGAKIDLVLAKASSNGDRDYTDYFIQKLVAQSKPKPIALEIAFLNAAKGGQTDLLEWLIEQGAEVKPANKTEEKKDPIQILTQPRERFFGPTYSSAIEAAAYYGHTETVKFLHQKGAPLDNVFQLVLIRNHKDIASYVLEHTENIEEEILKPEIFRIAVQNDFQEIIDLFFEHDVAFKPEEGWEESPVLTAVGSGKCDLLQRLLERGLRPFRYEAIRNLHAPFWNNQVDCIKLLLQYKVIPPLTQERFNSYIVLSVQKGFLEELQYLVEQGGDLGVVNQKGENLIHLAVQAGDMSILDFLVDHQVNVNHQTPDGTTPLISALLHSEKDMVRFLVKHNAKVSIQDSYGKTPLDYAKEYDDPEMIELLESYAK